MGMTPVFKSQRWAEAVPVLRPAEAAKGFGVADGRGSGAGA